MDIADIVSAEGLEQRADRKRRRCRKGVEPRDGIIGATQPPQQCPVEGVSSPLIKERPLAVEEERREGEASTDTASKVHERDEIQDDLKMPSRRSVEAEDSGPSSCAQAHNDPFIVSEQGCHAGKQHNFEYLDHTADVQIHGWGHNLMDAFSSAVLGMFNYMTPFDGLDGDNETCEIVAKGHDVQSLLFSFMDEFLFVFHTRMLTVREVEVVEFNRKEWEIRARGVGVRFDRTRHACGTEVKAITYSAMQIVERDGQAEVFVIVDI